MRLHWIAAIVCGLAVCPTSIVTAQDAPRAYRLNSIDLDQRVIWGAECLQPAGRGLAFGGQDQRADDGRPHTRLWQDGQWVAIVDELREANPLQSFHDRVWAQRETAKNILARGRRLYFQGLAVEQQAKVLQEEVTPRLEQLNKELSAIEADLPREVDDEYAQGQAEHARGHLERARQLLPKGDDGASPAALKALHRAQIALELAAEALDAEPPPRAMNCGTPQLPGGESGPAGETLVYDAETNVYVLFGGDHLDYLTCDTWVFDREQHRWMQQHPAGAPPPRANHRLEATGDGTVRMTGGYTYTSNTGYVSGQYADLDDGAWTYDIRQNRWSGGDLVPPETRVYRSGPFHPDFYLEGSRPDAAKFAAWLEEIPANEWVATDPPHLPRLNRDWGTARIDPDRDLMLRWSGGHSAHGGTDVLHYHFATNRWELPFPVEFPLGQLYSNTSYPDGFNFNRRPWMTGHTYQNYDYDPPSRTMIKAGRPRHFYLYDPDTADWIGRGPKPEAMQYNSCFYTLTLAATPGGVVCWDQNGRVHRYDHQAGRWNELELSGDKLPGAYVDNSTIAYDSRRDRVLIVNTTGYGKPFDGQVWAVDLKSGQVDALSPAGAEQAVRFANVDKCCYHAEADLLLIGTYLKDSGDHTPTPAYDCAQNRWVTLDLRYATGERLGNTRRDFPHERSDALVYDARRRLVWGIDTNSRVWVLRLDVDRADARPLE